jgi:hypothetical protein
MVTRTRRPLAIYLWLAASFAAIWPIVSGWPPGDSYDVTLWRGAPEMLSNYFDLLRGGVFLLALPYPFARRGRHSPDPPPDAPGPDP